MYLRGRYVLRSPWNTLAIPTKLYRTIAIRALKDLYADGIDPYLEFYFARGLTDGVSGFSYQAEQVIQANIITLIGDDGSLIYVPDTYIESFPSMDGVAYSDTILSIDLDTIPDYLDLADLKATLADVCSKVIGITPITVLEHRAPSTTQPTPAEAEVIETARTAAITLLETDHAKVLRLQNEKAAALATIATMKAILVANSLLP